jgi:hypothetical protein
MLPILPDRPHGRNRDGPFGYSGEIDVRPQSSQRR